MYLLKTLSLVLHTDYIYLKAKQKFILNKLLYLDLTLVMIGFILLGLLQKEIVIITSYILLYPYLYITKRRKALIPLYISSSLAFLWILISNNQYGYKNELFLLFGLNSFPLFSWAVGLFFTYIIYCNFEIRLNLTEFKSQMLLFLLIYCPMLIFFETIAYHIFIIRNIAAINYPGLPLCNCIHAPIWIQISYFLLGPLYFIICKITKIKNPLLN
jgi:hypothetical protein